MATEILGLTEITVSQFSKYVTHNTGLREIEAQTIRCISRTVTAEPTSPVPSNGDVYILGATHTGTDWAGYAEHDIAHYYGGAWYNYTPKEGVRLWVNDEDRVVVFDSSTWIDPIPILPTYTVSGVPTASSYTRGMIYVSDETGGAIPAFSDGTNWRRVTDRAIVA